jgi:hypothetical protein
MRAHLSAASTLPSNSGRPPESSAGDAGPSTQDGGIVQSGIGHLGVQLVRRVEVRVDETGMPVVASGRDHGGDRRLRLSGQPALAADLQQGHVPADRSDHQQATRPQDSPRFGQCPGAFNGLDQVIEGAQKQRDVNALVGGAQLPGVTDLGRDALARRGCVDVTRYQVDDVHGVAVRGQPRGVHPCATADVQNPCTRDRQQAPYQLLGAEELQLSMRRPAQARVLAVDAVMLGQL